MATILWSDSRIAYSLERALNNPFLLHIPDVSAEIARIWVFTTGTGIGEKWRGDEKYGEEDRTVEDDGESEVVGRVGAESFSSSSFITSSPLDRWRRYRSVWWWIVEMSNISPVTFFIISRNKKTYLNGQHIAVLFHFKVISQDITMLWVSLWIRKKQESYSIVCLSRNRIVINIQLFLLLSGLLFLCSWGTLVCSYLLFLLFIAY